MTRTFFSFLSNDSLQAAQGRTFWEVPLLLRLFGFSKCELEDCIDIEKLGVYIWAWKGTDVSQLLWLTDPRRWEWEFITLFSFTWIRDQDRNKWLVSHLYAGLILLFLVLGFLRLELFRTMGIKRRGGKSEVFGSDKFLPQVLLPTGSEWVARNYGYEISSPPTYLVASRARNPSTIW